MKSGMLAAESAFAALSTPAVEAGEAAADLSSYETGVKESWIWKELYEVRNVRPSFHNPLGNLGGIIYSGIDTLLLKGRTPWTFRNKIEDHEATLKASYVAICKSLDGDHQTDTLPDPFVRLQPVQADRLPCAGRQALV
jgi:electron-transferring-flavoprotein dehydrogenase